MKHNWETKKLNTVLEQYRETIWIDNLENYPQVTISKYDGVKLRGVKKGIEIGRKRQFKIDLKKYPFTFTFTRQGIQNEGTVGLCPIEVDGCIVTENMPLFFVKDIDPYFLNYYFQSNVFFKQLQKINALGTAQKSIHENIFLEFDIAIPPIEEQKKISATLEKVKSRLEEIKSLRTEQTKDINNLLFSKYTDLIENAEWLPMKEVAPIHRRQLQINPDETYNRIGVRSFGKGLFENPSFKGSELTWQTIFKMNEGDLLFSNANGWEGAVGLIPKKYDGWVGLHRYITCLPNLEKTNPEFLFYYFTTFEGVAKLSQASPGTVARTRTLNNKLLMQIEVPVPSIELQREFVELLNKTNAIKEHHKQTEQELTELMPSLLDKAFKGEL